VRAFGQLKRRTLWLVPAILNISAGIVLAMRAGGSSDVETVRFWAGQWLFAGQDLYASSRSGTDYPPHALVWLSPLSLVPGPLVVPLWGALNIVLAVLGAYLAARFVRPHVTFGDAAYLALLFLCWSGTKTLLQFSLLMLVFGLAAAVLAEKRPWLSGICLGLSLMKPQIAIPFVLWTLFTRRWKVAGVSALVVAVGTGLYCLRVAANPVFVAVRYGQILRLYYTGDSALFGVSQLRPLFARFGGGPGVDMTAAVVALALFAVLCIEGFQSGRSASRVMYVAPGLAGIWSLLTFYHLTYGFIVLLPLAALLLLTDDHTAPRERQIIFWAMQIGLMIDAPGIWRRSASWVPHGAAVDAVFANFDRLLMVCLFVAIFAVYRSAGVEPSRRVAQPV
jgi:hypothetical protein